MKVPVLTETIEQKGRKHKTVIWKRNWQNSHIQSELPWFSHDIFAVVTFRDRKLVPFNATLI